MSGNKQRARVYNRISIVSFVLSTLVIPLLPFSDAEKHPAMMILSGIIFWGGLLAGILFYYLSYRQIKRLKTYHAMTKVDRIGALAPGSTREGLIADILFVPFCIMSLLGTFVFLFPDVIMLISMWITLATFYGHFVLNGRVYKFLHIKKIMKTQYAKEGV